MHIWFETWGSIRPPDGVELMFVGDEEEFKSYLTSGHRIDAIIVDAAHRLIKGLHGCRELIEATETHCISKDSEISVVFIVSSNSMASFNVSLDMTPFKPFGQARTVNAVGANDMDSRTRDGLTDKTTQKRSRAVRDDEAGPSDEATEVPRRRSPPPSSPTPPQAGPSRATEAPRQRSPPPSSPTPPQVGPSRATEAPRQRSPTPSSPTPPQVGPARATEVPRQRSPSPSSPAPPRADAHPSYVTSSPPSPKISREQSVETGELKSQTVEDLLSEVRKMHVNGLHSCDRPMRCLAHEQPDTNCLLLTSLFLLLHGCVYHIYIYI